MRLLKEINILGRKIKVEYFDFDKALGNNKLTGNSDGIQQTIQIDSSLHREHQESTLLHEALHILSYYLHLDLDEAMVGRLESGLYQILKDNDLFKGEVCAEKPLLTGAKEVNN
jgi:hypothetical protein